jgi:GNAT superfamily N-acetyltransferase
MYERALAPSVMKQMPLAFTMSDLRQRPEFFDAVADRIWQTWWEPNGYPLAYVEGRLAENMQDTPIPLALIAHDGGTFLGTASVIASDLDERPDLTPWVAAVWVEERARRHGVGATLVDAAARASFTLGFPRAYLCARPRMTGFYERLGWTLIERRVGAHQLNVFARDAPIIGA